MLHKSDRPHIRALLLGEQGSGKSTRERVWTDALVHWRVYGIYVLRCILVFDRFREEDIWDGAGPVVSTVEEFWNVCKADSVARGLEHVHISPRVIVRAGMDPENYLPFFRLAIDEGDFLLVLCEVQQFAPSRREGRTMEIGRGVTLDHILSRGRHIPDKEGDARRVHYIADTQEAIGLSTVLRNQTNIVACGPLEGKNNLDWVRKNFGRDGSELADRVQAAGKHEWIELRNKLDRLVPKFPLEVIR